MRSDSFPLAPRVDAMLDEWEITRLIHLYANRIDANDIEGVVACFTDDCRAEYGGGAVVIDGKSALRAFLVEATAVNGVWTPSSHLMTNVIVGIVGDKAEVETTAMAVRHLMPRKLTVRGLRYVDTCTRKDGTWLISRRAHIPVWEFTVDGTLAPGVMMQALNAGERC